MARVNLQQDILPLSDFRADAAGMIQKVRQNRRALVLTQRGHSSAVVIDIGEYQNLLDELDLLRDICTASRQIDEGQGVSHLEAQSQALARLRV